MTIQEVLNQLNQMAQSQATGSIVNWNHIYNVVQFTLNRNEQLVSENKDFSEQNNSLHTLNTELQKKIVQLESQLKTKSEIINSLQCQNGEMHVTIARLEGQYERAVEALDSFAEIARLIPGAVSPKTNLNKNTAETISYDVIEKFVRYANTVIGQSATPDEHTREVHTLDYLVQMLKRVNTSNVGITFKEAQDLVTHIEQLQERCKEAESMEFLHNKLVTAHDSLTKRYEEQKRESEMTSKQFQIVYDDMKNTEQSLTVMLNAKDAEIDSLKGQHSIFMKERSHFLHENETLKSEIEMHKSSLDEAAKDLKALRKKNETFKNEALNFAETIDRLNKNTEFVDKVMEVLNLIPRVNCADDEDMLQIVKSFIKKALNELRASGLYKVKWNKHDYSSIACYDKPSRTWLGYGIDKKFTDKDLTVLDENPVMV